MKRLKFGLHCVETLDRMIRVKLMDGSFKDFPREEIDGLYPAEGILFHPLLESKAVAYLHGKVVPIRGPLPPELRHQEGLRAEEKIWIFSLGSKAYLILGLPKFDDDISWEKSQSSKGSTEEEDVLEEMDRLLKIA